MKLFTTLAIAATAIVLTMGAAEARGHGASGRSHHHGHMFAHKHCFAKHRWNHHHHFAVRYCHLNNF